MNILKYFENQFKINSCINTVEKNNVVYTAYYRDVGDGYSNVECTITTPFNSQKHSFSINTKIPSKLIENDRPVILPISDKDFVVFAFPEEKEQGSKKFSIISYAPYQVDLKPNSINARPYGEKISLSNNAKLSHSSNKYHSYSKPKAMELPNGDIIIAAIDSNSEGQYVTAWLLEKGQGLEFNVNEGSRGVVSRLLFKVDENMKNSFQLSPANQNGNVGKIIYSDSTSLFSLDITESMIDDIREGKYVNNEDEECLFAVGKERCDQFDKKVSTPFLTGDKISNLSAVNTKNGAVVAFLEDEQRLCLAKLTGKKGKKQIIHNYKEKIKSLQLSVIGENDIIISAVGEKNITQSTISSSNLKVVTTRDFPTDGVKTLSDFVDIVYNNPLKLTTSFPYTIFSTPKISSSTVSVTSPLSTIATEEITTRGSITTVGDDTTSAATTEITAQYTTTKQKTTKHITVEPSTTTVFTTKSTTVASPQTTISTERAPTTAKTTAETSTAQHTTVDQSTTVTTIPTVQPTTSFRITTPAKKTTISTNPATSQTAKSTSHIISSSSDAPKISSSTISTATPLAITDMEEITIRESTITVEDDTTSAATTQRTTTKPKITKHITVLTTQSTTVASPQTTTSAEKTTTTASTTQSTTVASPQTTTSTEKTTTTAKTTAETSTAQHTTVDQSTTVTTIPTVRPTTSSKITTSTEKITVKPTTKPTRVTTGSTARPTSRYTTSTEQDKTTVMSTILPKSTTTETQRINSTLGLVSTIGSAVVTTLGLVTQNVTNMITTDNNSMITDHTSNFNKTDESSGPAERSLNTAEISTAIVIPIVAMIGMSYLIYRHCCRSNIRLPSDYTDDIGLWQCLRRYFRSHFNGQGQTVPEFQLEPLDGDNANRVDSNEDEIVVYQKDISSSRDDLLNQNQSRGAYSSFTIGGESGSESGRSRSGSEGADVSSGLAEAKVRGGIEQSCNTGTHESIV
ncbi:hypothetical protein [Candidatus Mesenet endosymbiont of Agriotes lineatus]|uniref:hypothetical protein n=1 Tax=Candidatus Mesenet endosymbiont of Agriotes lineatus TaxID=3077948 RepID=UPI0030D06AC2